MQDIKNNIDNYKKYRKLSDEFFIEVKRFDNDGSWIEHYKVLLKSKGVND